MAFCSSPDFTVRRQFIAQHIADFHPTSSVPRQTKHLIVKSFCSRHVALPEQHVRDVIHHPLHIIVIANAPGNPQSRFVVFSRTVYIPDERPVRFQIDDREYLVEEVHDQWYGSDDTFFKVRTNDHNLYILQRNTSRDEWTLESFRQLSD